MLTITQDLINAIKRYNHLDAMLKANRFQFGSKEEKEHHQLLIAITKATGPLISLLSTTHLLGVVFDNPKFLKKKYKIIDFELTHFDEQTFTLMCGQEETSIFYSMHNGHPNVGSNADFFEYAREFHKYGPGPKKPYMTWLKENKAELQQKFKEYKEQLAEESKEYDIYLSTKTNHSG